MNKLTVYHELDYVETYMEFNPLIRNYTKDYLVYKDFVICYDDLITLTEKGQAFLMEFREEQEVYNMADNSGIDHNNIEMETMYE